MGRWRGRGRSSAASPGPTQGRLLTLKNGAMLAAVATERGVWVSQSAKANRFGVQHLLSHGGQMPETLDAAWLGAESSIVAWTSAKGVAGQAAPRSITYALGSKTHAPRGPKTAVTVPAGHRIDELGVAARQGGATAAWVESWSDKSGAFHSVVRAMDIAPHATVRNLSPANRLASGLSFAGDVAGDQALAWQSCTAQAACQTQADGRGAKGSFGPVRTLGADRRLRRSRPRRSARTVRCSSAGCAAGTRWRPRRPAPDGGSGRRSACRPPPSRWTSPWPWAAAAASWRHGRRGR